MHKQGVQIYQESDNTGEKEVSLSMQNEIVLV